MLQEKTEAIPERSDAAKSAKSVFFEEYNDIDIYIEDTAVGYKKLFAEIFSRVFSNKYRVSEVFPLGSRNKVIDECRKCQGEFTRPSLYIVDGDLFLFHKSMCEELPGLYILPFYCIENLLIDQNCLLKILNEEDCIKRCEQLALDFDFSTWAKENSRHLVRLFIEYAICFRLCPEKQTVKFPVRNIVSSSSGIVDEVKVDNRISEISKYVIEKAGAEAYSELKAEIEERILINSDSLLKYVSGKDYLIPLLFTRFRSVVRKTKIQKLNFIAVSGRVRDTSTQEAIEINRLE
jgi:hypothetical protein